MVARSIAFSVVMALFPSLAAFVSLYGLFANDVAAVRKAQFAAEGVALELWCAEQLLGRWVRTEERTFAAVEVHPAKPASQ